MAAAPSEIFDEEAAVSTPSLPKAARKPAILLVSIRPGSSSVATTVSPLRPLTVTGAISPANAPDAIADVDLFEVNEAFACVSMATITDLGVPHEKLNVNGGALALGHPIGASGARLVVTLLHALKARGGKRGIASLCIGGGEATAIAVEMA